MRVPGSFFSSVKRMTCDYYAVMSILVIIIIITHHYMYSSDNKANITLHGY